MRLDDDSAVSGECFERAGGEGAGPLVRVVSTAVDGLYPDRYVYIYVYDRPH